MARVLFSKSAGTGIPSPSGGCVSGLAVPYRRAVAPRTASEALPRDHRVAARASPGAVNEHGLALDLSSCACVAVELGPGRAVGVAHESARLVAADAGCSNLSGDVIAVGGERNVVAPGGFRAPGRVVAAAAGQCQEHSGDQRGLPATRCVGPAWGRPRSGAGRLVVALRERRSLGPHHVGVWGAAASAGMGSRAREARGDSERDGSVMSRIGAGRRLGGRRGSRRPGRSPRTRRRCRGARARA